MKRVAFFLVLLALLTGGASAGWAASKETKGKPAAALSAEAPLVQKRWGVTLKLGMSNQMMLVDKIAPDAAVKGMDIQEEDAILSWDDLTQPDEKTLLHAMATAEAGHKVHAILWRNNTAVLSTLTAPGK